MPERNEQSVKKANVMPQRNEQSVKKATAK